MSWKIPKKAVDNLLRTLDSDLILFPMKYEFYQIMCRLPKSDTTEKSHFESLAYLLE